MWPWSESPAPERQERDSAVEITLDELVAVTTRANRVAMQQYLDSFQTGDSRGRRLGRGLELESIGPYQPGDDVRHIDWQSTARIGQPQVKRFYADIQWTLMIAIDLRPSMYFGSQHQLMAKTACLSAAWLAFSLAPANQSVGFAMITDKVLQILSPQRGRLARLRRLAQLKVFYDAEKRSAFNEVKSLDAELDNLAEQLPGNNALVVISDFSYPGSHITRSLARLRRHSLGAVVIEDALALQKPGRGSYPLRLANQSAMYSVSFGLDTSQAKTKYLNYIEQYRRELAMIFAHAGVKDTLTLSAAQFANNV